MKRRLLVVRLVNATIHDSFFMVGFLAGAFLGGVEDGLRRTAGLKN